MIRKLALIVGLLGFLALSGGLVLAYVLVPEPHILSTLTDGPQQLNQPIKLVFDRPVSRRTLVKDISPEVPGIWQFEDPLIPKHLYRKLVFYPEQSFVPGTQYQITLKELNNTLELANDYSLELNFNTQTLPQITAVTYPGGTQATELNQPLLVQLDFANEDVSQFEFELSPPVPLETKLEKNNTVYRLTPQVSLLAGTVYQLIVKRTDLTWNLIDKEIIARSPTRIEYQGQFTTQGTPELAQSLGPVQVTSVSPNDGWTGVALNSPIRLTFNQAVASASAQEKFSLSPTVAGDFSWQGQTLIFTPRTPFAWSSKYEIKLAQGIASRFGQDSVTEFTASFTTQSQTYKLGVPVYLQQHALSCEVSALRMALGFRGIQVSEDELLAAVGVDWTPHEGNVWGDPYEKFVGNVNGKQMVDGFGVYWPPIARVARNYRQASEFTNWTISQLTEALAQNNPVIIWTYAGSGRPTSWQTPAGKEIRALRDEHTVTVVGFVGPSDDPSQIIVNDPLHGQVYWSRSLFERKWEFYGHSGVVVY